MSSLRQKLNFFRDCLRAESRGQAIWNVRTSKNELIKTLDISYRPNEPSMLLIKKGYAESLTKVLELYSREKQLMMGQNFIITHHDVSGFGAAKKQRKICCPIIYIPCELKKSDFNGHVGVLPKVSQAVINPAAKQFFEYYGLNVDSMLNKILADSKLPYDQQNSALAFNELIKFLLESDKIHFSFPLKGKLVPNIKNNTSDMFKHIVKGSIAIIPETLLYITRKQASAQGSLHEIETMIERNDTSSALAPILTNSKSTNLRSLLPAFGQWFSWDRYRSLKLPLPVVLSDAQATLIENSAKQKLSIAVGPPGTGKSFTIASLALKEFTRGKSVLVVSQNQHAVDVVRRKLIDDFGIDSGLTVLGNDDGLSRDVKTQLNQLLRLKPKFSRDEYRALIKKINAKLAQREDSEADFLSECNVQSGVNEEVEKRFFGWLSKQPSNKKSSALTDQSQPLLSEQFCDLEELDNEINMLTAKLVNLHYRRKVNKVLDNTKSRNSVREFAKSLTARNSFYQEKYYRSVDFSHVLSAVPFWFAPLSSLSRLLPLQKELFDMVIIDEATQCNFSVCIPALYRAKKAVIVGDPKQLGHVSFVSYELQQSFFDRHSLNPQELSSDFRNNSVLDYAIASGAANEGVTQLDEHFRSHPQIIGFSNREFYDSSLKVMTTRPNRIHQAIELRRVNGERKNGVNRIEADDVVKTVKKIINDQARLPQEEVQSLGVLSFFSDQAEYIEKILFNDLGLNALRRHNLRVGTPFSFQGEERDHMLLSCCVDASTTAASYTYLNRDDVFNVAITRARDLQTIFLSCEPSDIKANTKLNAYIKYCLESAVEAPIEKPSARDAFQDEIYTWLQEKGIKAYKNYVVAGISIDLMAVYEDRALAIDLVGFDGDLKGILSLKQFKLLARAGLKSFLLPYNEWRNNKSRLLEQLLLQLGALAQLENDNKPDVAAFNDEDERFIDELTGGISINQLNTRFVRSNERRAAKQIVMLLEKRARFERALHLCFIPSELTFKRYKNAFHDLIKDCVIKLKQASIASELASSLLEQQKQLFGSQNQYGEEYNDIFEARASMVDEQKNKIKHLLSINESALLQMDKTCIKLNKLYESADDSSLSSHDILEELTEKIDLYKGVVHKRSE